MSNKWLLLVSEAKTLEALQCVMCEWHQSLGTGADLHQCPGFDLGIGCGDFERARQSVLIVYGTWDRAHRGALEILTAAVRAKRVLRLNSAPTLVA